MKKFILGTAMAIAASAASAADIGVTATRDYNSLRNGGGINVGHNMGDTRLSVGVERFTRGNNDLDRYNLTAAHPVVKTKFGNLSVLGGGAYLNNQVGKDGFALFAGVGYSYPVTKTVSFGLDVTRQFGQDRVKSADGNAVTAGLTFKF